MAVTNGPERETARGREEGKGGVKTAYRLALCRARLAVWDALMFCKSPRLFFGHYSITVTRSHLYVGFRRSVKRKSG